MVIIIIIIIIQEGQTYLSKRLEKIETVAYSLTIVFSKYPFVLNWFNMQGKRGKILYLYSLLCSLWVYYVIYEHL